MSGLDVYSPATPLQLNVFGFQVPTFHVVDVYGLLFSKHVSCDDKTVMSGFILIYLTPDLFISPLAPDLSRHRQHH